MEFPAKLKTYKSNTHLLFYLTFSKKQVSFYCIFPTFPIHFITNCTKSVRVSFYPLFFSDIKIQKRPSCSLWQNSLKSLRKKKDNLLFFGHPSQKKTSFFQILYFLNIFLISNFSIFFQQNKFYILSIFPFPDKPFYFQIFPVL